MQTFFFTLAIIPSLQIAAATFTDDFNDNARDAAKWGAPVIEGTASLQEAGQRLNFSVSSPGDDNLAGWPWLEGIPIDADWEATVGVYNDSQPTTGNDITSGLQLSYPDNGDEHVFIELYAVGNRTFRRGVLTSLDGPDDVFGEADTLNLGMTSGKVRMSFKAATQILTTSYEPAGSSNFTTLGTFGLKGSGGATANRNWNLRPGIPFTLLVGGFSLADAVAAGRVWLDDFHLTVQTAGPQDPLAPVAYYPFDGNARDESGNGHDGILVGSPGFVPSVQDLGLQLAGTNFVEVAADASIGMRADVERSISVWINLKVLGADPVSMIVSKYVQFNSGACEFAAGILNTGQPTLVGNGANILKAPIFISTNEWHHLVYILKAGVGNSKIYVDGTLAIAGDLSYNPNFTSTTVYVGAVHGSPPDFFMGLIDELRIYDRVLSGEEIGALFRSQEWPPTIVVQPAATNFVTLRSNLDLTITAAGSAPLAYQWFHETAPIGNATNAVLALRNVQLTDAGGYFVRITNSVGSIASQVARVVVQLPPPVLGILTLPGIQITGVAGLKYRIEYSTSVSGPNWTPLATTTLAQSPYLYPDLEAIMTQQRRYYRAVAVP